MQSHAPLQIAQLLRNARRFGRVSEERMTSATMSEMNGASNTAPTAAPVAHDGNGSSTGSGHRETGALTGVGFDWTTGGSSAACVASSVEYARPQRWQN